MGGEGVLKVCVVTVTLEALLRNLIVGKCCDYVQSSCVPLVIVPTVGGA